MHTLRTTSSSKGLLERSLGKQGDGAGNANGRDLWWKHCLLENGVEVEGRTMSERTLATGSLKRKNCDSDEIRLSGPMNMAVF